MQVIYTYYLGPTDTKGGRVKARIASKGASVTLGWDHSLSIGENHKAAAIAVAASLGWAGEWIGGDAGDNGGYVYVNAASGDRFTAEPVQWRVQGSSRMIGAIGVSEPYSVKVEAHTEAEARDKARKLVGATRQDVHVASARRVSTKEVR